MGSGYDDKMRPVGDMAEPDTESDEDYNPHAMEVSNDNDEEEVDIWSI